MTDPWIDPHMAWTVKELFVYPNEAIYWGIQIVMYPLMTGFVAGAFVLSALYHVFDQKDLKEIARFSLLFSFALLLAAPIPLLFHLQQPLRCMEVFFTPHLTSAIASFGLIISVYFVIVATEIWCLYRKFFVEQTVALKDKPGFFNKIRSMLYHLLTLGAYDISETALQKDKKAIKLLSAIGIPVACFLHGYAGFIFGSVKANALWMTPLMPVIFIVSAIVSGIALSILTYTVVILWRRFQARRSRGDSPSPTPAVIANSDTDVIRKTTKYLIGFMIFAISLELLDLVFRGYTAMKSWTILRSVIYEKDFANIFLFQFALGNFIPLILLCRRRSSVTMSIIALVLVVFGVFMMRWNVVIGGQAFSLSFVGYMHYHLPIIPHNLDTLKEGVLGALIVGIMPFVFFWGMIKFIPFEENT